MPVLTKDRQITRKEVRGLFAKSFITQSRDVIWPEYCETIDTFSETEYFAALGTVPQVEEIEDDTEVEAVDMREFTYDFTNRLFKTLLRLKRSLVDFDQTGQSRTLLHSLAGRIANWPDLLSITQLRNGESNTCLTGSNFFATDHALGGTAPATQSNLVTGSTATDVYDVGGTLRPGIAELLQTDLDLALVQLLSWRDDNNQPFFQKIRPEDLIIVCGPKLFTSMKLALGAKFINQTDNIFEGFIGQILSSNYLPVTGAEAADWYLMYVGHVNRPLVYSRFRLRTDTEMQDVLKGMEGTGSPFNITMEDLRNLSSVEILTNLGNRGGDNADSHVILHEEFLLAARFRGEVAYGIPWTAIKINNAAT
jgi:phage major head subunit gpT-like protein